MLFYDLHLITTLLDLQPGRLAEGRRFFSHNAAFVSRSQLRFSPFLFRVTVEIPRSADEQHQYESQSVVVGAFVGFFHLIFSTFLGLRTNEGGLLHRSESTPSYHKVSG